MWRFLGHETADGHEDRSRGSGIGRRETIDISAAGNMNDLGFRRPETNKLSAHVLGHRDQRLRMREHGRIRRGPFRKHIRAIGIIAKEVDDQGDSLFVAHPGDSGPQHAVLCQHNICGMFGQMPNQCARPVRLPRNAKEPGLQGSRCPGEKRIRQKRVTVGVRFREVIATQNRGIGTAPEPGIVRLDEAL